MAISPVSQRRLIRRRGTSEQRQGRKNLVVTLVTLVVFLFLVESGWVGRLAAVRIEL
jgi:hypothetical protein